MRSGGEVYPDCFFEDDDDDLEVPLRRRRGTGQRLRVGGGGGVGGRAGGWGRLFCCGRRG